MTRFFRLVGLAIAGLGVAAVPSPVSAQECSEFVVTAYAASDYPGLTADGSTTTVAALNRGERIAAASSWVPFGSYVQVVGVGNFRVADRGYLGPKHLDILMRSRYEALEFGRQTRVVCLFQ